MTIDWNFLSQRYNRDHGTKYQDGVAMVADLYDQLGGAYGVADKLVVNHGSIYNFMRRHGLTTQPRGRERDTPKNAAAIKMITNHPEATNITMARMAGISDILISYYKRRMGR